MELPIGPCQETYWLHIAWRLPDGTLSGITVPGQMVEQLEALQVKTAREDGWTWERIADALGVTRQSVHRKYASRRLAGRRLT
jgi:hypothetical protein